MNKLTIKDGRIYLDDKKIEGVTEYSVKSSEPIKKLAELNLKLIVSTEEDNEKTAQEGQVQEQSINLSIEGISLTDLKFHHGLLAQIQPHHCYGW